MLAKAWKYSQASKSEIKTEGDLGFGYLTQGAATVAHGTLAGRLQVGAASSILLCNTQH